MCPPIQSHGQLIAWLLLAGLLSPGRGQTTNLPCDLTLPSEPVTVFTVEGQRSYFEFTLSGVPVGVDVRNGCYKGWCTALPVQTPVGSAHQAILLSTLDTNLPPHWQSDNWDLINYILNHKQGRPLDVQLAIWYFTDGITNELTEPAIAMINDALARGEGFVPQAGQVVAVALDWLNNEPPIQPAVMEVPCPRTRMSRACEDFVTGGGFIFGTPTGAKANFGVQGGIRKGRFWGGLNYIDHATGMHVKSRTVTAYAALDANCRQITYNVTVDGLPATATVRVCDFGEPGRTDLFEIMLSSGYTAGGLLAGGGGGGGNIQLHRKHCDAPAVKSKAGKDGKNGKHHKHDARCGHAQHGKKPAQH